MKNYVLCLSLQKVALPTVLLACTIFRPCLISGLYLLLALLLPFFNVADKKSYQGSTGCFLRVIVVISFFTVLAQIGFQVVLFSLPPYAHFLPNCSLLESILRYVGLVNLKEIDILSAVIWLGPELVMLCFSVFTYVIVGKLAFGDTTEFVEETELGVEGVRKRKGLSVQKGKFAVAMGCLLATLSLCVASSIKPTVIGGFYFIVFIGAGCWWASGRDLRRGYAYILRLVQLVAAGQLIANFTYQIQFFQPMLSPDSLIARLVGLEKFVVTSCDDPRKLLYRAKENINFLDVIFVYIMYFITIQVASILMEPQPKKSSGTFSQLERANLNGSLTRKVSGKFSRTNTAHVRRWQNATRKVKDTIPTRLRNNSKDVIGAPPLVGDVNEQTHLLRGISSTNATSRRSTHSKRSGEGDGSEVGGDNIPMQDIDKDGDRYQEASTTIETIFYAVCSLMFVIIRSSYLATNIIMMTWSITYHSWLTLVLLMWANVIWLFPNQRKSMLYSSPFLLLYAIFLIISQYVYALDLLDSELPVKITNFNLEQIGFYRPLSYKFAPILIKSLFTAMFAVTTRQYMQERKEAKKRSTLADIVSPLQVTMGAAVSQQQEEMTQNAFVKKFGASVRLFLVKYWIWVVAFTLFLSGITGQNMTAFRIIYMALFLTFLFLFQVSWRLWRSLMYLFWVIVIVYSMTLLVILYTYQFDNFPDYWEKYLFIDKDLQNDIGLVKYSTSDLFARLLTATFFVIISVIQVHYFHKEFLNMTRLQINERTVYDSESGTDKRSQSTTATQAHRRTLSDDSEFPPTTPTQKRDNVYYSTIEADASRIFGTWESWKSHAEYIVNLIWLFLELHMLKIVLFAIMLMSANDISAIHFVLITMTVISLPFGRKFIFTVRVIVSGVICVVFLLRMIYQIDYITHDYWQIDCSESISNTTDTSSYNMAAWLGFQKLQNDQSLFNLLRWYIIYIAIATFQSVVDFRQIHQRQKIGASLKVPSVMFPEIAREDADKDSWHCLKYLLNYGFYKFGVECSLVCTVMIVCYRTDVYAVFYGIWLAVMCTAPRERIEKLWNYFMLFTVVIVPFQYFCVVGLPPFLCLEYPWNDNATLRALQAWFYAMNNVSPPPATKIILDFVLLICQTRQRIVFYIERRYDKKDRYYPGGSNKDITKDADVIDFVNPVPDFVMVIRTWLDIWKRGIFIVFLWFTLATIFLTGTSRVNVFSIGYLVGAFLFLWQGSDLFLRPITNITNIWDYLIMYNVFVTLTKSILSLFGCVFIAFIQQYACWAIEVFNIGCIQYFYQGKPDRIASPSINFDDTNANCDASTQFDEMSLHWDLFCFACLIFQRRIFKSYYFFHIIDETKAMTILASRGAELIEELRRKHVKEQEEKEKQILENIKTKMDRIKENQKKIQGPNYADPDNHFVAGGVPLARDASLSSSCTSPGGYHTPISDNGGDPLIPGGSCLQPPSPCSALMTVSLDMYLEPKRMSFESPPHSDLNQRAPSLDESFPVFSPPPYGDVIASEENRQQRSVSERRRGHQRQISIGPPWMGGLTTPRQSIISYSERTPISHHTYKIYPGCRPLYRKRIPVTNREAVRSGDYYMFDNIDDGEDYSFSNLQEEPTESEVRLKGQDLTFGELISTVAKTNDFQVITVILRASSLDKMRELRRRASMPPPETSRISPRRQTSTISAPEQLIQSRFDDERVPLVPASTSRDEPDTPRKPKEKYDQESVSSRATESDKPERSGFEEIEPKTIKEYIIVGVMVVWIFVKSVLLTMTIFFNKFSKNYRFVRKVLIKEKKLLKEKNTFRVGIRRGSAQIWQPLPSTLNILQRAREQPDSDEIIVEQPIVQPSTSAFQPSGIKLGAIRKEIPANQLYELPLKSLRRTLDSTRSRRKSSTLPEIRILAPSQEGGLDAFDDTISTISSQDEVSYEVPKLEEVEEMSSADQPVPIRLALSLWFFVLANSEICCYFMVFLNQIKSASIVSLPLPLMVFLWGTLTIPRPTKTFWVTMIAYVEVLVIVKCMFQFRFLPWNELDASTSPFFPPRILGIERKADYATYDLWLLLIIFFHRSMLKSLGLWKSSYAPIPHFSGPLFYPEDDTPLVLPGTQENLIEKRISLRYTRQLPRVYMHKYKLVGVSQVNRRRLILNEFRKPKTIEGKRRTITIRRSIDEGNDGKSQALVTQGGGLVMFRPKSNPTVEEVPQEDEDNPVEKVISNVVIPEPTSSELEAMGSKFDLVVVSTNDHEPYDYFPNVIGLSVKRHFSPAIKFWQKLKDPSLRVATDVYAYMFLCDFFNFLVIIFGFTAFGTQQGDGGVQAYLKENKVPIPFLVMLILQFILILIDRALFLRKYILGKIIFQFALIALVHIYMFFVLPAITERGFNSRLAPQMWYMVKCFYLLLSAYQIRSGYPTRILGNFLCKGYNYINFGLFKCFMLIPFLFELRTIMDWIWTDTSMTLFDWLKMEDIFANIFQLKCQRYNEKEFPQVRGEKKPDMSKFLMGGAALFIIIGIIWFPLVLFALGKTVGVPNIPIDVTMKLHVGSYLSIYSMSAQTNQIIPFGPQKWDTVNSFYLQSKDRVATTFLTGYDADDVCEVALSTSSTTIWNISPPDEERLYNELNSSNIIQIRAQYIAKRDATNLNGPAELSFEAKFDLPANEPDGSRTPQRIALMNMLRKSQDPNATVDSVLIPYMLPKFLRLSSSLGTMSTVDTLMKQTPHAFDQVLRNITISLSRQEGSSAKWWVVKENCSGYNYENVLKEIPGSNCGQLQLYLFNEKKFPPTLSFISGGGIISLYTTLVFFASRFVRGFFSDIYSKIMFEDLPNVDRIMQLCLDIYLVRESRELALEEDLFAKLVFLYRSPETLIKWTRPKYELVGDESELGQPSITNQPAN